MSVLFEYFAQRAGVEYFAESLNLPGVALKGRKIDHQEIYHDAQELGELKARVKAGGQDYLEFLVHACEDQCNRLVAVGKELRVLPAMKAFDRYCAEQMKLMTFLPLFPGVIEPLITGKLESIAQRYATTGFPAEKLAGVLAKPSKPYATAQEEIARYSLGEAIQRDSSLVDAFLTSNETAKVALNEHLDLQTALMQHITKFGWVETRHFKGDSWSLDDVINRVRGVLGKDCAKAYKDAVGELQGQDRDLTEACELLKISYEDRRVIKTIRDFIYLRTQRKDAMSEAAFHMQWAFDEIAKNAGLDAPSLVYLMPHEIKDAATHPEKAADYLAEIAKRKKGFVLITYDGETRIFTGEFVAASNYQGNGNRKVAGTPAFPGEVEGLARRIMSKAEIGQTRQGEIVVTPTTSTDYVMIADKMAGVITDEGGITCHAAQISREYKIPCIIGTGNATQIFNTGDKIYLNAAKGHAEIR